MSTNATLYPTGPGSTATTAAPSVTGSANYSTFEAYNNADIDIIDVSSLANGNKFLTMVTAFGRSRNDGKFDEVGLSERMISNYPEIRYKEQDKETDSWAINAAAAAGTAGANMQITLTSTAGLTNSMILRVVRTNEQVRVVSVDSGTLVTVTRKTGDAPNVALTTSDVFVSIATAVPHGVANLTDTGAPGVDRVNYIQKLVQTVELDDGNMFTAKLGHTNSQFIERRLKQAQFEMRNQLERLALFGEKGIGSENGKAFYTTEGAISMARRGWTDDISAALTTQTLEDSLTQCTNYMAPGSDMKILLLGSKAKSRINALYTGRLQYETIANIKEQVETITIGTGKFVLMQSPFMNATTGYAEHGLIVDPAYFKICYPTGGVGLDGTGYDGKIKLHYDPTSTYASQKASLVGYVGFQCGNANSGGLIKIAA